MDIIVGMSRKEANIIMTALSYYLYMTQKFNSNRQAMIDFEDVIMENSNLLEFLIYNNGIPFLNEIYIMEDNLLHEKINDMQKTIKDLSHAIASPGRMHRQAFDEYYDDINEAPEF